MQSGVVAGLTCAAWLFTLPGAFGQVIVDNFDDGNLDGWQQRNVVQPIGGFVDTSFPAAGSGKALRLKRGSADMSAVGLPQAYGTGRAWLFRPQVYSDFYVAMDVVDWNNSTNQAIVLLARASGFDETAGPGFPPGLGTTDGYVANYDNAQDGTGAGDRRGGQFQINRISDEGPRTIAAADITLVPGRSYRMTFTGVSTRLTARIYDYYDLTRPLVTIEADDSEYASGASGIVSFHRDDGVHPNQTDMTVDNYYSGPSDPDAATLPVIRHPIEGTPQVIERIPAKRNANFHPIADGIQFTVSTFGVGSIDATATKLFLNDVDVSASLAPLPANGASLKFKTAPGTLQANSVYSGRIEVTDTSGKLKATHTFWFDTFTDAYLKSPAVKTIEAEDYNFAGGSSIESPVPVSGLTVGGGQVGGNGSGYFGLAGIPDVDFHDNRSSPEGAWKEYRDEDAVGTMQGGVEEIEDLVVPPGATSDLRPNDTQRSEYAAAGVPEYQVARTEAGEWLNYTRTFAAGRYIAYLRTGSFESTTVALDRVTSNPAEPGQTTANLGSFEVPNHMTRYFYRYVPLTQGGQPVVLDLSGKTTLRLTIGGTPSKDNRLLALNYLLFVPAPAAPAIVLQSAPALDGTFSDDASGTIDTVAKTITIPVAAGNRFYRVGGAIAPTIKTIQVKGGTATIQYE